MVILNLLKECADILKASNIPNSVLDSRVLICHALSKDELFIALNPSFEVDDNKVALIRCLVQKRASKMPISYITHKKEFMGLEFYVDEHVLIPRADTECLVEETLKIIQNIDFSVSLLDIGTGSGAIGISLAYICNTLSVCGIDISKEALAVAMKNALTHKVNNRTTFFPCDILSAIPKATYDIIVSNPPYIEPEIIDTLEDDVKNYEPIDALTDHIDGLTFYRRIAQIAKQILNPNGSLLFEIGYNQKIDVMAILEENQFSNVYCIKDLAGNSRVVVGTI